jgi:hypothetical protein
MEPISTEDKLIDALEANTICVSIYTIVLVESKYFANNISDIII